MGFLDNFGNEFGKKTGKALGNKLYGKHADDVRRATRIDLNVNRNNNNSNDSNVQRDTTDYEAMEKAKRKTLQQEQEAKFLESIINVEFDSNDKDGIIKTLTTLSAHVDLWTKESNKNANVARSKFDAGLAILSMIDSQNPMVNFFMNKKIEWITIEKTKKQKRIYTAGGIAIAFIIFIIIIIIS